jgi:hypothetical protein
LSRKKLDQRVSIAIPVNKCMYIHGSEFSKMFKGQAERECFKKIEGPMLENMHCWTSCLISPCYGSIKTSQYCFTAPFLCYHAMSIWWQEALQGHIKAMLDFFFLPLSMAGRCPWVRGMVCTCTILPISIQVCPM